MKLEINIQHPTSNIQRPTRSRAPRPIGCSLLDVGCWIFLLFIFSTPSLSAQTSTNALPALVPAYGELPPTFWEQHGSAVLIVAAVALLIAVLVTVLALRPKPASVVPPEIEARRALEEFRSRAEDGAVLSRVSQILRRYFIAVFALPPGEYTTAEFSRAISAHEKIGAELSTAVSNFLRACDGRKFSAAPQSSPSGAVQGALELIGLAEARRIELDQSPAVEVFTKPNVK
jgi:hypothetical protein